MIKFELTEQHFNIVVDALGNTAYRISAPVIAELARQSQEQRAPAQQVGANGGDTLRQ